MNEVILDSILFMKSLRDTLCEFVETTDMDNEKVKEMQNFFVNEATDYQVLHTVVLGEIPEEKYDIVGEANLMNSIKMELFENDSIKEIINEDVMCSFMENVVSPSMFNISTAKPILEFQLNNFTKDNYNIREASDFLSSLESDLRGDDPAKAKGAGEQILRFFSSVGETIRQGQNKIDDLNNGILNLRNKIVGLEDPKKQKIVADRIKKSTEIKERLEQELAQAKEDLAKATSLRTVAKLAVERYSSGAKKIGTGILDILRKVGSTKGADGVASKTGGSAVKGAGIILGGIAVAGLLGYAANKTYQRFFSKAGKACKNAEDKSACMKEYKKNALSAQLNDIKKGASACNDSKDAKSCFKTVGSKIEKIKSKLEKIEFD